MWSELLQILLLYTLTILSALNSVSFVVVGWILNFWCWCIPKTPLRDYTKRAWNDTIAKHYPHTQNIVALQYLSFSSQPISLEPVIAFCLCINMSYMHAFLQGSKGPSSTLHLNPVAAPTAWNSTAAWVPFTTKPALMRFTLQVVEAVGMYTFQDTSAFSPTAVVAVTRKL